MKITKVQCNLLKLFLPPMHLVSRRSSSKPPLGSWLRRWATWLDYDDELHGRRDVEQEYGGEAQGLEGHRGGDQGVFQ